jgi:general secretion pathway protein G
MRTMNRTRRSNSRERGFSLIELMAVVVILGLLIGMVAVAVRGTVGDSRQNIAAANAKIIVQAIEQFALQTGRIPSQDEGLSILVTPLPDQPTPYLKPSHLKDPWGGYYEYIVPGRYSEYEIVSYGRDGQPGGEGEDADVSTEDEYEEDQL